MASVHLHRDDYPDTLAVLHAVLGRRDPAEVAEIGYVPDEWGAEVDWDRLDNSWLSTTERASLRIAHIASTVDDGGLPAEARGPVREMIDRITNERNQ